MHPTDSPDASTIVQWVGGLCTAVAVTAFRFVLKRRESQRTLLRAQGSLLVRMDEKLDNLNEHLGSVSDAGRRTQGALDDHKTAERPHSGVDVRIDALERKFSNGSG